MRFLLALCLLTLVQCKATPRKVVRVDGSSTVFPMSEAAAEEFQTLTRAKIRVTVGASGTGGGFKKFCRGETDLQGASRPITKVEMGECQKANIEYIELPVAYDAITVVVSRKNEWLKSIKAEELKKIWEPSANGKIFSWKDVRADWPDLSFRNKLYAPGSQSGTFDYFTEAIVGKGRAQRPDYTASEDDNTTVTGVAQNEAALGYVPFAYYKANESLLRVIPVDGGPKAPTKGPVEPTLEAVRSGKYFPLSRPLFVYVNASALQKPEVLEFVQYYLERASEFAEQVKYIPLSEKAYDLAKNVVNTRKLGTAFGGESMIGMKIEELLQRETVRH